MRDVPLAMTEAWQATAKTGARRPVVRATVQRQRLYRFQYDTAYVQGGDPTDKEQHRAGYLSTLIFGEDSPYREIPNIISFSWDRAQTQDAATASMTLLNTEVIPIGDVATAADALDRSGFLTYNHGDAGSHTRWGQSANGWLGVLVPDAVIKTYEGYGIDPTVMPAQDTNLMPSGVWMVDTVTLNDDGSITVAMRDLARVLLDTDSFPPVIPFSEYPLSWVKNHLDDSIKSRECVGGHWKDHLRDIGTARSSNDLYIGQGFTNAPYSSYVASTGAVEGHAAIHAIGTHDRDTDAAIQHDDATYWRATGQDEYRSMVWWEFDVDGSGTVPVGALRVRPIGGPFRVYVSVHNGSNWIGRKTIPYELNGIPGSPGNFNIHADIPFVTSVIADRFFSQDWVLPRIYNAAKIRLTFTRLRQREVGEHPFRAGLRELQIYTAADASSLRFQKGTITRLVGNYGDFTHIIKWVCAWAGWYWPGHETGQDFIRVQGGGNPSSTKDYVSFTEPDPVLPKGRVWGDFMKTGTAGEADLTHDQFDKKPLMDMISYVRDIVGFVFFIDETGGVVWRAPNIGLGGNPKLGNYVSPAAYDDGRPGHRGRGGRTREIVTLDDETVLLDYSTVLDSKNVRERVFIANSTGKVGTVVKGFNPFPIGLLRVAGWTDQHFKTKQEVRIMADLVVAQQMFSYKTARATIPGYPKIQVDDMVRIYERVTSETFYHHVIGIHSEINMAEGTWTYDLTTHWLGTDPTDAWVIDVKDLHAETQQYLAAIGFAPVDGEDNDNNATWVPGPGSSGGGS